MFRDLIDYTKIKLFATNTANNMIEELTLELKYAIIEATPVGDPKLWKSVAPADYVPGTLKASWESSYSNGVGKIINEQPYAQRVEDGWSTQAPSGMVKITLKNTQQILDRIASTRRK